MEPEYDEQTNIDLNELCWTFVNLYMNSGNQLKVKMKLNFKRRKISTYFKHQITKWIERKSEIYYQNHHLEEVPIGYLIKDFPLKQKAKILINILQITGLFQLIQVINSAQKQFRFFAE